MNKKELKDRILSDVVGVLQKQGYQGHKVMTEEVKYLDKIIPLHLEQWKDMPVCEFLNVTDTIIFENDIRKGLMDVDLDEGLTFEDCCDALNVLREDGNLSAEDENYYIEKAYLIDCSDYSQYVLYQDIINDAKKTCLQNRK